MNDYGTLDSFLIIGLVWDHISGEGARRGIYCDDNIEAAYSGYHIGSQY